MKTSAAGLAAIEQREGKRLAAYRDTRGIWTIGVGHAASGLPPHPRAGMTITEAECQALLDADLAPVEAAIGQAVHVPLSQNEFDALVSLGFNIGAGGLRGSSVVRELNLGNVAGAANAFRNWEKPAVLKSRREAERAQFLTPDATTAATAAKRATVVAKLAGTAKATAAATTAAAHAGTVVAGAAAATAVAGSHPAGFGVLALVASAAGLWGALAGWRRTAEAAALAQAAALSLPP